MKRPSFQFYPADLTNNAKVKRCSWGARGVWMWVIAILHDSDEYGVIRWQLKEIASAIGAPLALLKELVTKGVLKGSDGKHEAYVYTPVHARKAGRPVVLVEAGEGPCWYSSRMVRDEWRRLTAGASSRFGRTEDDTELPDGDAPSHSPSQRRGAKNGAPGSAPSQRRGDGSSSSSSSSQPVLQTPTEDARATPPATPLGDKSPFKINVKTEPEPGWWKTPEGIAAEGKRQGVAPRWGEVQAEYKARLFANLHPGEVVPS